MLDKFKKIIYEICDEEKISYRELSSGWIIELNKNGQIRYITGMRFPLNNYSTATILNDKFATYSILSDARVPVIEHNIFFNPSVRGEYNSMFFTPEDVVSYFNKQDNHTIIIKANDGFGGKEVFKCTSVEEIYHYLEELFKYKDSVCVCPFYDIKCEYRLIYLKDECKLIFGKVASKNGWKHNLAQGANVLLDVPSTIGCKLKEIAGSVLKLLDCEFVSIDIAELEDGRMLVMEVNSSVSVVKFSEISEDNRITAKEIYRDAIKLCFK